MLFARPGMDFIDSRTQVESLFLHTDTFNLRACVGVAWTFTQVGSMDGICLIKIQVHTLHLLLRLTFL